MSDDIQKKIISFLQQGEISANEKEKLLHFLNQQTKIHLYRINIGDSGAKILADVLKINNTLTTLSLDANSIEKSGAQAIADALKMNRTLKHVHLSDNYILNSGVQAIADALKMNNTLTSLHLKSNYIGEIGARAIADALKVDNTLIDLNLHGNHIGNAGACAIADALKVNSTLTTLWLRGNHIGDSGACAIADALKVDRFPVKVDTEVELTNTSIENIEQALKIRKVLLQLDLSWNYIGNDKINTIAEMLKVNNSLQVLDIRENNFTGISKLGDAIKCNRSLTELAINENKSSIRELEKALQFNICLLYIRSHFENHNYFESSTIKELLKRNKEIQTTLSKRIFKCKNPHLSLLDYKILERVNVAVIFKNVWELEQTQQQTGKTYEECLREYWELISLNTFSKNFLFILGVCKPNQIPPSKSHLLGIPKEILNYIGSFLNPKDFLNQ